MTDRKAYLVGSGIASLASASYLLRDGHFKGQNIFILEESDLTGGSLDGAGDAEKGYVMRGGRTFNFSNLCTYDLLSFVPSLVDPRKTILQEIKEFNTKEKFQVDGRLIRDGFKIDITTMGFSYKDRFDLLDVMMKSEESLGIRRIEDCFEKDFFESNFWYMWATMFAFQPWHSAVEFKRYLHRFIHDFSRINNLERVDRLPYNQFDSLIRPLVQWLKSQGVHFVMETEVHDLEFREERGQKFVSQIHYRRGEDVNVIPVDPEDLVFITNGSMTAASSLGSMRTAPLMKNKKENGAWSLWEKIAAKRPEFGHPGNFDNRVEESKWLSFTCTLKDPRFFQMMERFTGNTKGSGGLVSLTDSNWLMSVVLGHQPQFVNQPPNVQVFWGYGLFIDNLGNYIPKKMHECTGEEILEELCFHLGFMDSISPIMKSANCIPCLMPFIGSPFLTRAPGDRPEVVPEGYANLAFVSQFCEIPDDVVFTVEYSVRAAQMAVYKLLHLDKEPPPVFETEKDFSVLFNSLRSLFQEKESETAEKEYRPSH